MEVLSRTPFANGFAPVDTGANYFGIKGSEMLQVYSEDVPTGMSRIPDDTSEFALTESRPINSHVYSRSAKAIRPDGKYLDHRCLA